MRSVLPASSAVFLWLTVALRAKTAGRDPVRRLLWITKAIFAVAMTMDIPPISRALDRLTPNLIFLLMHSLALAAAWSARETLRWITLSAPRAADGQRRRLGCLAAAIAALGIAFAAAPVHAAAAYSFTGASDFTTTYAANPAMDAYWLIFLGVLTGSLVSIAHQQSRFVRHAAPGPLRTGMAMVGLAAAVGVLYVAHKALYLALRQLGETGGWYLHDDAVTGAVLIAVGVALALLGILWPQPARPRPVHTYRAWTALRTLQPLWETLCRATPGIALPPPPTAHRLPRLPDLQARLYERVVEIHDGILALHPYLPDPTTGAPPTADAPVLGRNPTLTARHLAVAHATKLAGRAPSDHPAALPPPPVADDWRTELQNLQQLARAWNHLITRPLGSDVRSPPAEHPRQLDR